MPFETCAVSVISANSSPERGGGPATLVEGEPQATPLVTAPPSRPAGAPPPRIAEELEEATLLAHVSKGTYIRSLARDIALALGTVGHVTMLRRTKAGPFGLQNAISLDKLDELGQARALEDVLLPLRVALDDIPALSLTPDQAGALRQGRILAGIAADDGQYFAELDAVPVALVEVEDGDVRVVRGFNL